MDIGESNFWQNLLLGVLIVPLHDRYWYQHISSTEAAALREGQATPLIENLLQRVQLFRAARTREFEHINLPASGGSLDALSRIEGLPWPAHGD